MVFYFTSSQGYLMYMGADKYENEDLIKFGLPEDVWFHVDGMSSAHVYLRLKRGERIEDVSPEVIQECSQLVKANSIEGCKLKQVYVIYTWWSNLLKTPGMEVGAVSFKDQSIVHRISIEKDPAIVKAINKTKSLKKVDLMAQQEERRESGIEEQKQIRQEYKMTQKQLEKQARREKEEKDRLKSYKDIFENGTSINNTEFNATEDNTAAKEYEENFM